MSMVAHAYDPRIQKVKHEDHHAFEASYIAGSRPSWATERDLVSKIILRQIQNYILNCIYKRMFSLS